jgi:hypothetical protein
MCNSIDFPVYRTVDLLLSAPSGVLGRTPSCRLLAHARSSPASLDPGIDPANDTDVTGSAVVYNFIPLLRVTQRTQNLPAFLPIALLVFPEYASSLWGRKSLGGRALDSPSPDILGTLRIALYRVAVIR